MKARKEVMELDPYVPGRSKEEIAQEELKKRTSSS